MCTEALTASSNRFESTMNLFVFSPFSFFVSLSWIWQALQRQQCTLSIFLVYIFMCVQILPTEVHDPKLNSVALQNLRIMSGFIIIFFFHVMNDFIRYCSIPYIYI